MNFESDKTPKSDDAIQDLIISVILSQVFNHFIAKTNVSCLFKLWG